MDQAHVIHRFVNIKDISGLQVARKRFEIL